MSFYRHAGDKAERKYFSYSFLTSSLDEVERALYPSTHWTGEPIAGLDTKQRQSSPATRHGGPWGERRYNSYSFLISALDGGEWSALRPGRALPRGKDPRYPLYRRLGGSQSRSGHRG
jgi:hypothetical protein